MIKYRYNAAEKFRLQSINLIKKEREKIMDEANDIIIGKDNNDSNRNTYGNMSKTHMTSNSKENGLGQIQMLIQRVVAMTWMKKWNKFLQNKKKQ